MNSSHRKHRAQYFVAALVLGAIQVCAHAAQYMTPEFARAEFRPVTLVLIPPRAEVIKQKIAGSEAMIEEGASLEDATSGLLAKRFRELGYEFRVLKVEQVNADPELQLIVRNFNERYDDDIVQVYRKPKDVRSRRFTIGDEARILAARLDADALVVVRIEASGATGGQQTMAFLLGGSNGQVALGIGVVAGDNGDLEGYFTDFQRGLSPRKISEEPVETMAKVSAKVLKNYPKVDQVLTVSKSWPQSTDREVPEAGLTDEEVFADLEGLIETESQPADGIEESETETVEAAQSAYH